MAEAMSDAQTLRDPDRIVGVRDCGCITAWMMLDEHSGADEIAEFYASMAATDRAVHRVRLEDIRGKTFRCEHGGMGEGVCGMVGRSWS